MEKKIFPWKKYDLTFFSDYDVKKRLVMKNELEKHILGNQLAKLRKEHARRISQIDEAISNYVKKLRKNGTFCDSKTRSNADKQRPNIQPSSKKEKTSLKGFFKKPAPSLPPLKRRKIVEKRRELDRKCSDHIGKEMKQKAEDSNIDGNKYSELDEKGHGFYDICCEKKSETSRPKLRKQLGFRFDISHYKNLCKQNGDSFDIPIIVITAPNKKTVPAAESETGDNGEMLFAHEDGKGIIDGINQTETVLVAIVDPLKELEGASEGVQTKFHRIHDNANDDLSDVESMRSYHCKETYHPLAHKIPSSFSLTDIRVALDERRLEAQDVPSERRVLKTHTNESNYIPKATSVFYEDFQIDAGGPKTLKRRFKNTTAKTQVSRSMMPNAATRFSSRTNHPHRKGDRDIYKRDSAVKYSSNVEIDSGMISEGLRHLEINADKQCTTNNSKHAAILPKFGSLKGFSLSRKRFSLAADLYKNQTKMLNQQSQFGRKQGRPRSTEKITAANEGFSKRTPSLGSR